MSKTVHFFDKRHHNEKIHPLNGVLEDNEQRNFGPMNMTYQKERAIFYAKYVNPSSFYALRKKPN